jgi:hypothetical protein
VGELVGPPGAYQRVTPVLKSVSAWMKGALAVKLRLFAIFSVLSFAVAALAAFAGTA